MRWAGAATFRVYLPRVDKAGENETPDQPAAGAAGGSETILVVEDEIDIQNLIRKFLETKGYTVLTAGDGLDALRVFDEHDKSIELMLTDVVMPA